jgi:hypothetical protein
MPFISEEYKQDIFNLIKINKDKKKLQLKWKLETKQSKLLTVDK